MTNLLLRFAFVIVPYLFWPFLTQTSAQSFEVDELHSILNSARKFSSPVKSSTLVDYVNESVNWLTTDRAVELSDDQIDFLANAALYLESEIEKAPYKNLQGPSKNTFLMDKFISMHPRGSFDTREGRREALRKFKEEFFDNQSLKTGFKTIEEQDKIFSEIVRESHAHPGDSDLEAMIYLGICARRGILTLLSTETFQNSCDLQVSDIDAAKSQVDTENLLRGLKRKFMQEYFDILTLNQKELLAGRLSCDPHLLSELTDTVKVRHFDNFFKQKDYWVQTFWFSGVAGKLEQLTEELVMSTDIDGDDYDPGAARKIARQITKFLRNNPSCILPIDDLRLTVNNIRCPEINSELASIRNLLQNMEAKNYQELLTWSNFISIPVRFHVREFSTLDQPPSDDLKHRIGTISQVNRQTIPVNFIDAKQIEYGLDFRGDSLTQEQKEQLAALYEEQAKQLAGVTNIEDWVLANNQFLEDLNLVLLPVQASYVFQRQFGHLGPHAFFSRPDVIKEFEITAAQQRKFRVFSETISTRIERETKTIVLNQYSKFFSGLPSGATTRIEECLGCELDRLIDWEFEKKGAETIFFKFNASKEQTFSPMKLSRMKDFR